MKDFESKGKRKEEKKRKWKNERSGDRREVGECKEETRDGGRGNLILSFYQQLTQVLQHLLILGKLILSSYY